MTAVSLKAHRFSLANEKSAVVYASVEDHVCVYRLQDGTTWRLSMRESADVGYPRFAHLTGKVLGKARAEELELLKKLRGEAQQREWYQ